VIIIIEQNLSLYRVFYTVANLGNISGAAEQLFVSQPAVSQSIRKLEKNMECALFVRKPRGVELTEEGKVLYEHVEEAINVLNQAETSISKGIKEGKGHLRIGTNIALCKRYLLPYMNIFLMTYPKMRISISFASSEKNMEDLAKHKIDLALVHNQLADNTMKVYPLGLLHIIFASKPNYYKRLGPVTAGNLSEFLKKTTFVLLQKQDSIRKKLHITLENKNIKIKNIIELNFIDLVIDFTRLGMGIGCVAKEFIEEDIAEKKLVEVPLGIEFPSVEVCFVRLNENISNPALKMFREMLVKELALQ
jgi:DNA-binding transcriptional LysR family regulator